MSYSSELSGCSGEVTSSETIIVKGETERRSRCRFKLTADGNYDLKDNEDDDDYNTRVQDLKSAVNKEYLNEYLNCKVCMYEGSSPPKSCFKFYYVEPV